MSYWKALKEVSNDYRVFVHITQDTGADILVGWDHEPVRGRYPTSFWRPGDVIEDRGLYFLPHDFPQEVYFIRVGLLFPHTEERLMITHAAPEVLLDDVKTRAAVGTLRVS